MDLPPLGARYTPEVEVAAGTIVATLYPVPYFLCDRLTDSTALKELLNLDKAPKLRKARIVGYQRARNESGRMVAWDGQNYGAWNVEEVVKGVVYDANNAEEERKLTQYVGGNCEVKAIEMEVACPSLLGKVGRMKTIAGRIFVPAGEGDTLVGSSVRGDMMSRRSEEIFDHIVAESRAPSLHIPSRDGGASARSSLTITLEDGTLRLNPPVPAVHESAIPHLPLEAILPTTIAALLPNTLVAHPDANRREPEPELHAAVGEPVAVGHAVELAEENEQHQEEENKTFMLKSEPNDVVVVKASDHADVAEPTQGISSALALEAPPSTLVSREEADLLTPHSAPTVTTLTRGSDSIKSFKTVGSAKSRKTSDSIKSLVMKYENLSPQASPAGAVKKAQ